VGAGICGHGRTRAGLRHQRWGRQRQEGPDRQPLRHHPTRDAPALDIVAPGQPRSSRSERHDLRTLPPPALSVPNKLLERFFCRLQQAGRSLLPQPKGELGEVRPLLALMALVFSMPPADDCGRAAPLIQKLLLRDNGHLAAGIPLPLIPRAGWRCRCRGHPITSPCKRPDPAHASEEADRTHSCPCSARLAGPSCGAAGLCLFQRSAGDQCGRSGQPRPALGLLSSLGRFGFSRGRHARCGSVGGALAPALPNWAGKNRRHLDPLSLRGSPWSLQALEGHMPDSTSCAGVRLIDAFALAHPAFATAANPV